MCLLLYDNSFCLACETLKKGTLKRESRKLAHGHKKVDPGDHRGKKKKVFPKTKFDWDNEKKTDEVKRAGQIRMTGKRKKVHGSEERNHGKNQR